MYATGRTSDNESYSVLVAVMCICCVSIHDRNIHHDPRTCLNFQYHNLAHTCHTLCCISHSSHLDFLRNFRRDRQCFSTIRSRLGMYRQRQPIEAHRRMPSLCRDRGPMRLDEANLSQGIRHELAQQLCKINQN